MLQAQKYQTHQLSSLYHLTGSLKNSLETVDELIIDNLNIGETLIQDIAKSLIKSGGKRLRPLLCLACSAIAKEINQNSIYLAAAVELIHAATLLHDDVIDESNLRRGAPTANTIWGNKPSILVGDFLFARAFELMVKTSNIKYLDILAAASTQISEGEITQLRTMHSFEISIAEYINIIEKKTAILFEAACQTGTMAATDNQAQITNLKLFGKYFGIMYQIIDDINDYISDNRGKIIGDDFKEGKITLPVLLAFQTDSDKDFWIDIFSNDNKNFKGWQDLQNRFIEFDIIKKSKEIAKTYQQKAAEQLFNINHPYAILLKDMLDEFF